MTRQFFLRAETPICFCFLFYFCKLVTTIHILPVINFRNFRCTSIHIHPVLTFRNFQAALAASGELKTLYDSA
jgi:hypothetical protein